MAQTVAEVLARHDASLTEQDVAEVIDQALDKLPGPSATTLTKAETRYLAAHAGEQAADVIESWSPAAEYQQRAATSASSAVRTLADTLGIEEVAKLLGVDRSRISHRISAGALYSFTTGRSRRRVPVWQFTDGGVLPHLARIVTAIPGRAHPMDVASLMATPQNELADRTPREHLENGGDPRPVTELLQALGSW